MEAPRELRCNPSPECKYYKQGCFENSHHLLWPRNEYRSGVHKRLYAVMVIEMCAGLHDLYHEITDPPKRPTDTRATDMLVNRSGCYEQLIERVIEGVGHE